MRKKVSRRASCKLFAKTANKTKAINLKMNYGRGGICL